MLDLSFGGLSGKHRRQVGGARCQCQIEITQQRQSPSGSKAKRDHQVLNQPSLGEAASLVKCPESSMSLDSAWLKTCRRWTHSPRSTNRITAARLLQLSHTSCLSFNCNRIYCDHTVVLCFLLCLSIGIPSITPAATVTSTPFRARS